MRRALRAHMQALPTEALEAQSRKLCDRLYAYLARDARMTIACYMAMPHEVKTTALIEQLHTNGKRVVIPKVAADAGRLEFYRFESFASLKPGRYGISEPDDRHQRVPTEAVEVVCVPGVAFDRSGRRLGQGGGYFDRLLAQWGNSVTSIGLALDCQIVPQLPIEAHDHAVSALITETGWLIKP